MKLRWIGLAILALTLLPSVEDVVYATGPNPAFSVWGQYVIVGSSHYPFLALPAYLYIATTAFAVGLSWFLEERLRPRGGATALAVVALIFALPLPLIFYEQNNLTIIVISNILKGTSSILYLLSLIIIIIEHYIYADIRNATRIVAEPEAAAEKTQKV